MLSHNFLTCDGGGEPGADVGFFLRRKEVSAQQARAAMQTAVLPANLYIKKHRIVIAPATRDFSWISSRPRKDSRRHMKLLHNLYDLIKANFQVIYLNNGNIVYNDKNAIAYNYLWTLWGRVRILCFFEYHRDKDTEQFAPLTILRYIDINTNRGIYVAPFTVTLGGGSLVLAVTLWAVGTMAVRFEWEPANALEPNNIEITVEE